MAKAEALLRHWLNLRTLRWPCGCCVPVQGTRAGAQHALQPFECSTPCFAGFTGVHPTADQWQQAALGFAQAAHAPAAYLALFGSSFSACTSFSADAVTMHVDVRWLPSMPSCQVHGLSLDAAKL